jgi:serine-type D-Ala-D-Ala carboxypeptidase/endopeptidase
MKRKLLAAMLVLFTTLECRTMTKAEAIPSETQILEILRQRIEQEKQSPSIVVGIIDQKGRRVIHYISDKTAPPVNGDTLFEIGSISKVFTAMALTQMAERGDLKLDDPISRFLPQSVKTPTRNGKAVSLLSLATHTSGLPRLPDNLDPKDVSNPYADYTVGQLYAFLSNYQLTRDIGAQYEYSNLGAGLLGHILSMKAGTSYEMLIKSRIAQPLQMNDTSIQLTPKQQVRFAKGHNALGKPVSYWDLPTLAGAGALRSTTNDLLKFLAANLQLTSTPLNATLQKTHLIQHSTETPNVKIAIGWHVLNHNGTEIIMHDGGTGGFRSFIGFVKQKRLGVVVLSNSENDISDIGLHLLDESIPLAKRTPPKQRKAIAINPTLLDAYVGRYQLAPDFILTITKEQNRLYLQATGQPKVELFPETETQFFITEVDAQVTFVRDRQGTVNQLILHQAGQNLPAKKLSLSQDR